VWGLGMPTRPKDRATANLSTNRAKQPDQMGTCRE